MGDIHIQRNLSLECIYKLVITENWPLMWSNINRRMVISKLYWFQTLYLPDEYCVLFKTDANHSLERSPSSFLRKQLTAKRIVDVQLDSKYVSLYFHQYLHSIIYKV